MRLRIKFKLMTDGGRGREGGGGGGGGISRVEL